MDLYISSMVLGAIGFTAMALGGLGGRDIKARRPTRTAVVMATGTGRGTTVTHTPSPAHAADTRPGTWLAARSG